MRRDMFLAAVFKLGLAAVVTFGSVPASAQTKASRLLVGNQPGGATDIVARLIAPRLAAGMGQTFIVENRAGASGNIAAEAVARAAPDGQTILLIFNSHPMTSALFPKLSFDPIKDFTSIGLISESPYLIVARPDIGADTFKSLIEQSKKSGKPLSMGSPGPATPQHLLMERIKKEEGIDVQVVHFKGTAPALTDVMGGHVDLTLVTPSAAAAFVKAGKAKLLGVTSNARLPEFPSTPTASEQGLKSLANSGVWLALLAPAKTPKPVIDKLNQALTEGLRSPEVTQDLAKIGMTPMGGSPEDLDKKMKEEQAIWPPLIRELNLAPGG